MQARGGRRSRAAGPVKNPAVCQPTRQVRVLGSGCWSQARGLRSGAREIGDSAFSSRIECTVTDFIHQDRESCQSGNGSDADTPPRTDEVESQLRGGDSLIGMGGANAVSLIEVGDILSPRSREGVARYQAA